MLVLVAEIENLVKAAVIFGMGFGKGEQQIQMKYWVFIEYDYISTIWC